MGKNFYHATMTIPLYRFKHLPGGYHTVAYRTLSREELPVLSARRIGTATQPVSERASSAALDGVINEASSFLDSLPECRWPPKCFNMTAQKCDQPVRRREEGKKFQFRWLRRSADGCEVRHVWMVKIGTTVFSLPDKGAEGMGKHIFLST